MSHGRPTPNNDRSNKSNNDTNVGGERRPGLCGWVDDSLGISDSRKTVSHSLTSAL